MKSFEDYLEGEREKITMDMRTFLKLHEKAGKQKRYGRKSDNGYCKQLREKICIKWAIFD